MNRSLLLDRTICLSNYSIVKYKSRQNATIQPLVFLCPCSKGLSIYEIIKIGESRDSVIGNYERAKIEDVSNIISPIKLKYFYISSHSNVIDKP